MSSSSSSKESSSSSSKENERIDLRQLAKDLAQDEWERMVYRPPEWPAERYIDHGYEPTFITQSSPRANPRANET